MEKIEEHAISLKEVIQQLENIKKEYGNIQMLGLNDEGYRIPINIAVEYVSGGIAHIMLCGGDE